MKYKKGIICCILITMFLNSKVIFVNADNNENNASVVISTDINKRQSKKQIDGVVTVQFNDKSLYNENVKLSYHIYNKSNKIILFENERIPLKLVDGKATVIISIKLDESEATAHLKNCIVRFDLVDEKNIYWFCGNSDISFKTVDIQYADVFLNRVQDKYGFILGNQQIQLIVSIVFIFVTTILYRKYKKSNQYK